MNNKKIGICTPMSNTTSGLIALCWNFVQAVLVAKEMGLIPIIDLQHHATQYFKDNREFKDNAWEYYFKQPSGLSLSDITEDDQITFVNDFIYRKYAGKYRFNCDLNMPYTTEDLDNYKKFPYTDTFMKCLEFSDEMQKYAEENYRKVVGDETEVLGILCRGTDYINTKPEGHYIQPEPDTLIQEAKDLFEKYHYKKIYVATEDLNIYNKFKKAFGDILLENTQYKYGEYDNSDKIWLSDVKINRENHNYLLGKEYLASMYILSKCKYFIGGLADGIVFVYMFSKCFENMKYIHLHFRGRYKSTKKVHYTNFWQRILSIKKETHENIIRKVITILGLKLKFVYKVL